MEFSLKLECDKLLGAGTSGKVYRLCESIDDKKYAVKRVPVTTEAELENAKLEAKLHGLFQRDSIVGYHYSWVERGGDETELCILLDLVDQELWQVLLESPPSTAECHAWSNSLLDALQAVHEQRVVHRDLSPWNVFVSRGASGLRRLRLGDFGMAARLPDGEQLSGLEQDGCPPLDDSALGSPFSAPELGATEGCECHATRCTPHTHNHCALLTCTCTCTTRTCAWCAGAQTRCLSTSSRRASRCTPSGTRAARRRARARAI